MKGYYELKKTEGEQFQFTLNAGNHDVILSSRLFPDKASARDGVDSIRANGPHEARYERKLSAKGEPYFSLKSPDGHLIGTSDVYEGETSRDNGIKSVISNCASIIVKDLTELAQDPSVAK